MRRSALAITRLLVIGSIALPWAGAADVASSDLEHKFAQTVRPFLASYCVGCHGGATPAAQFDLQPYTTVAAVVRDYPRWNLVLEKLTAKEMPPKQAPQPPADVRQEVIDWVRAERMNEARKNAGDPGPVLVRRLSNAEYNNTIRDLTGVDMRPTREFPVDPANTAGFDNSGESLAMSPALVKKYLDAARLAGRLRAGAPALPRSHPLPDLSGGRHRGEHPAVRRTLNRSLANCHPLTRARAGRAATASGGRSAPAWMGTPKGCAPAASRAGAGGFL